MRLAHLALTLSPALPVTAGAQGPAGTLQGTKETGTTATGMRDAPAKV